LGIGFIGVCGNFSKSGIGVSTDIGAMLGFFLVFGGETGTIGITDTGCASSMILGVSDIVV
jgi:hypothetical protein